MDDAVAAYAKAAQYAPRSGLIRTAYGHALLESKTNEKANTAEAIRQFEASLQTEKKEPAIHRYLAIAYGKQGNQPEAQLHLAEESLMQGKFDFAFRQAKLARQGLPKNSTGWLRADDILDAAIRARKDKDKHDHGE